MSIGNKNKSDLNLFCQKSHIPIAAYTSAFEDGNFVSTVTVKGCEYHSTCGYASKKEAENDAAGVALIAILQTEFGGKTIEEVLLLLEQRFPSKNKKKSKQAANYSEPTSQQQVEHRVQMDSSSNTTTNQVRPTPTQHTIVSQPQLVGGPTSRRQEAGQRTISQPRTPPQVGVPQTHTVASTVPHGQIYNRQGVVESPHSEGTHESQMVVSQPSHAYHASSYPQSHQIMQQPPFVNQGHPRGGLPEHVQRTANPAVATPANFYAQHQNASRPPPPTHSQPGPRPIYTPSTGTHPQVVQGHIQPNSQPYVARPGVPVNYQGPPPPPPPGFQPHPHVRGMYPPRPPTNVATGVQATPTPGMRHGNIAARFPGAAPPISPILNPQQQVASAQTSPGKPLNAIPVSVGRQSHPAGITSQESLTHVATSTAGIQNKHAKALEDFCRSRNLRPPNYRVKHEGRQKFSAEVIVGHQSYRTQWTCDDFEQAKTVAAMEALANLAISLNVSDTGIEWVYGTMCTCTITVPVMRMLVVMMCCLSLSVSL